MGEVYIAGAAMTRVGRRDESLPDLMAEAGRGALADVEGSLRPVPRNADRPFHPTERPERAAR